MANLPNRVHDHKLVTKMLEDSDIQYFYHGGLGREGDQFEIARRDLAKWTQSETKLIDGGQLRYYTSFGLDDSGLGFVDLRE